MVVTSVAKREARTPLTKESNDENETYTSFKDIVRKNSLLVQRTKEVSGVTDSSDALMIVQVRDCDEDSHTGREYNGSLSNNRQRDDSLRTEISTQKRVQFHVSTAPEYTIKTKEKRNNYTRRKRVSKKTIISIQSLRAVDQKCELLKPCLSRADVLGRHVSSANMRNPSAHSLTVSRSCLVCFCLAFQRVLN